ncbi:hypothetical protein F5Y15DRAFT_429465 [Xylariaceae sp. FL0016]|nr:hypothetical protein F5Y15DRAFT_429465 [Xylariaceae sp. FL0016]
MGQHNYPYPKFVNIAVWFLQISICLMLFGYSVWFLAYVKSDKYDYIASRRSANAVTGLQLAAAAFTIIADVVEIVLISRQSMAPALYLSSACSKTFIWTVVFILHLEAKLSLSLMALAATMVVECVLQLTYGTKIMYLKRKGVLTGRSNAPARNLEAGRKNPIPQSQPWSQPESYELRQRT